MGLYL